MGLDYRMNIHAVSPRNQAPGDEEWLSFSYEVHLNAGGTGDPGFRAQTDVGEFFVGVLGCADSVVNYSVEVASGEVYGGSGEWSGRDFVGCQGVDGFEAG